MKNEIFIHSNAMKINTLLKSVPYDLPPRKARAAAPVLVGVVAIKVYQLSPGFWAVTAARAGRYQVQFATVFGAGHRGFEVSPSAAAEFISHTAHPFLLLQQIQKLGWLDLAAEFESVVARIIRAARSINQFNNQNDTFTKN